MNTDQPLCINCINCVKYKKLYHCDYDRWTNKKLNDILIFIPQMFDCFNYEQYKGNNHHIKE